MIDVSHQVSPKSLLVDFHTVYFFWQTLYGIFDNPNDKDLGVLLCKKTVENNFLDPGFGILDGEHQLPKLLAPVRDVGDF
jgi:hypothetical protein